MKRIIVAMIAACAIAVGSPAAAQQTTGNIQGQVIDAQKAAVPGVTVTAKSETTGFTRTEVTDAEGVYRLNALPVGVYTVRAELAGFAPYQRKEIIVNLGQQTDIHIDLKVGGVAENVSVTAESPLIPTTTSAVGGVVDVGRIESLPLNGRQFANAAVTIPGVMLGFHSDPTKSTQFSPQIGGGNGRNVNYQIDGGDNNDDTVGGLLQLFPLEAIQEFQFVTSRYKAEYGRSNGGVMNIVTKGGTNDYRGSWFTMFRDTAMNAMTETERRNDEANAAAGRPEVGKQDYRRYQYRRIVRRSDRARQGALLRGVRADAAGHLPGRQHAGSVPRVRRSAADAVPREPVHRQDDVEHHADAVSGGALRPQQQLAAVRRGRACARRTTGARAPTSSTRSTSITTGCSAAAS